VYSLSPGKWDDEETKLADQILDVVNMYRITGKLMGCSVSPTYTVLV